MKRRLTKTEEEIQNLREGGRRLVAALEAVKAVVAVGVTTEELDRIAEQTIRGSGGIPSFKGYRGFPGTLCTSINEEVVHGIPSPKRRLAEGDIIGLDIGMVYNGLYTDMAETVGVGRISKEAQLLIDRTRESLSRAIAAARTGATLGDIGYAVQSFCEGFGYGVVRELVGHGVGYAVHEEPKVPNFGEQGQGLRLEAGMVLALEPMITMGKPDVRLWRDGWTVRTADRSLSAHFEHTIVVRDRGGEILTLP